MPRPRSPETSDRHGITRLKRRSEFLRVAGRGRKWAAPGLVLQARRHQNDEKESYQGPGIRVGFTVTRKVGNAVQRNRAKRRLREAANRVLPDHARSGFDFVVIGRAATLKRPFEALLGDLVTALRKLDAYKD